MIRPPDRVLRLLDRLWRQSPFKVLFRPQERKIQSGDLDTFHLVTAVLTPFRILIRQGMAKTHRILLHFHGPHEPLEQLSIRSLQFQLPDRPALSHDWMLGNDPWGDGLCAAEVGDRMMGELIARFMDRSTALGMLYFGDAPDAGYSASGGGQTVWINNRSALA